MQLPAQGRESETLTAIASQRPLHLHYGDAIFEIFGILYLVSATLVLLHPISWTVYAEKYYSLSTSTVRTK